MRKTKLITIDKANRDNGKVYLLTEMAASQAEKWAARVFFAMAKSGIEIPDDTAQMGMAGMLHMGLSALGGIEWSLAEPLLDEMMTCIKKVEQLVPQGLALVENDIEEVGTRLQLRKELLQLHVDFSFAVEHSTSAVPAAAVMQTSPITRMFPGALQS